MVSPKQKLLKKTPFNSSTRGKDRLISGVDGYPGLPNDCQASQSHRERLPQKKMKTTTISSERLKHSSMRPNLPSLRIQSKETGTGRLSAEQILYKCSQQHCSYSEDESLPNVSQTDKSQNEKHPYNRASVRVVAWPYGVPLNPI